VATVGLAPLTLLFFQQVSLVGFVSQPAGDSARDAAHHAAGTARRAAAPLWTLGAWSVHGLTAVLAWLAGWPLAVWTAAAAPPWAAAAGLLGGLLLVLRLPWRLRALGCRCCCRCCGRR
jgi:competence protein ComEC